MGDWIGVKAEVPALCQLCSAQMALTGTVGRGRRGQRPLCSVAAGALFCPCSGACTLECKQPFHVASSCLSLLASGRRGAKNNQAGTSTGGTFTAVASGQPCLLPAGPGSSGPCSDFLWPPPPQPLSGASTLPSVVLLRVSPGGWGPPHRPRSSARCYQATPVLPCPCRPCWHS